MPWKTLFGLLIALGAVVLVANVKKRRRASVESLGPVSGKWIAEHRADISGC